MEIKLFVDKSIPDEDIKEEVAFLRRCLKEWIIEPKYTTLPWRSLNKDYKKAFASSTDIPFILRNNNQWEVYDIKVIKTDLCVIEDAYLDANVGNKIYIASLNPRYAAYLDDTSFCKVFNQGSSNISVMRKALIFIVKDCFNQNKIGNDCKKAITKYLLGQTFPDLRGDNNG